MKKVFVLCAFLVSFGALGQLFGPQQVINETTGNIRVIEVADIDGDGYLDIITGSSAVIGWYQNMDGNGSFNGPLAIDEGMGQTLSLAPADIDGDGNIDVVVSYFDQDMVVWYRNTGLGIFEPLQVVASGLNDARGVTPKDLDGDNDLDLVLGVTNGTGLYWIENIDGQGTFGALNVVDANIPQARTQAVEDLDGDGDMDILTNSDWGASWYENMDGLGSFSSRLSIETGPYANVIDLVDIDGDSDFDTFLISGLDKVLWRENLDGTGNFGSEQIINDGGFSDFVAAETGDLDNDGDLDVIFVSIENLKVIWQENLDGLGNFGPTQSVDATIARPARVALGDFDMDGDMDAVVNSLIANGEKILVWYENQTILTNDVFELDKLRMSPNPVGDFLAIESPYPIEKVVFYDALGRRLLEVKENFREIDVTKFSSGLLFVEVATRKAMVVKKLVKQ